MEYAVLTVVCANPRCKRGFAWSWGERLCPRCRRDAPVPANFAKAGWTSMEQDGCYRRADLPVG